jgi:hypothetical protein
MRTLTNPHARESEVIIKQGETKKEIVKKQRELKYLQKSSEAKNFKSWLTSRLQLATLNNDKETQIILDSIINKYNEFSKVGQAKFNSWKGKSGIIDLIQEPERIIVVKMQKPEPDSEPQEVRIEITKEEVNAVIESLNILRNEQPIPTSKLAMVYSNRLNMNHKNWKDFFSDRINHNKLTIILNVLDNEGLIKYERSGKTRILKDKLEIQPIFK